MSELDVFYDADCGICTKVINKLGKLEYSTKVNFLSNRESNLNKLDDALRIEVGTNSNKYMYVYNHENRNLYRGSDAFSEILKRNKKTRFIGSVLSVRILRPFFRAGYYVIASNRKTLSGRQSSCKI